MNDEEFFDTIKKHLHDALEALPDSAKESAFYLGKVEVHLELLEKCCHEGDKK